MWQNYELAVSLYNLNVNKLQSADWQIVQNNTLQNRRPPKLQFTSTNNLRCRLNVLPNCLKTITNRIDIRWLTVSKEAYKQKCKKEFITTPLMSFRSQKSGRMWEGSGHVLMLMSIN